jgi:hypothetical protein
LETKPLKDIATDLSKLGYFSADIYGEGIIQKTTLKRVKVLLLQNKLQSYQKKELH